jgi:hypothetical protein
MDSLVEEVVGVEVVEVGVATLPSLPTLPPPAKLLPKPSLLP